MLIGSRAARGVIAKSQYGAAKAALVGLARAWAKELAPRGIAVNVVAPAATETAMLTDPARAAIPPPRSRRSAAAYARGGRGACRLSAVAGRRRNHRPGSRDLRRRVAVGVS